MPITLYNGGPAFPQWEQRTPGAPAETPPGGSGVSLRAYIATKTLAGILSNAEYLASASRLGIQHAEFTRDAVRVSCVYADALIAELNRKPLDVTA